MSRMKGSHLFYGQWSLTRRLAGTTRQALPVPSGQASAQAHPGRNSLPPSPPVTASQGVSCRRAELCAHILPGPGNSKIEWMVTTRCSSCASHCHDLHCCFFFLPARLCFAVVAPQTTAARAISQFQEAQQVKRQLAEERKASAAADAALSFRQKEKRKRDAGQASRGKNYVEEEKRLLRDSGVYSGFDA